MSDTIKIHETRKWNWNDNFTAKEQFHDWHTYLVQNLGLLGIEYVLRRDDTTIHRPNPPGDQPDPSIANQHQTHVYFTN